MKRIIAAGCGILLLLFVFACPAILMNPNAQDLVIALGLFDAAGGADRVYAGAGGTLYVPILIADLNQHPVAGSYTVNFILSVDNDLTTTADNTDLGPQTVAADTDWVVALPLPGTVVAGVGYSLFASLSGTTTATDALTNNNTTFVLVNVGATNTADLQVTVNTVNAGFLPVDTSFNVVYEVANTGFGTLAAGTTFTIDFTASLTNAALVTSNVSIGSAAVTLPEILYPVRGSYVGTATLRSPTSAVLAINNAQALFTFWGDNITATVDSTGIVAEASEANNTDTFTLNVAAAYPDLTIDGIELPPGTTAIFSGKPIELRVRLANEGAAIAPANSYGVRVFVDLNDDWVCQTTELLYDFTTTPIATYGLDPDQRYTYFDIPDGVVYPPTLTTYDGTLYPIRAEAYSPPGAALQELEQAWNFGGTADLPFRLHDFDLQPSFMSVSPSSVADGSSATVSVYITNNGTDAVTDSFDIQYYVSIDNTFTGAGPDVLLESYTVTDDIPASGAFNVSRAVLFPDTLNMSAIVYVYAILDTGAAIAETDESNNRTPNVTGAGNTTATQVLVFDNENAGRTYDIRFRLYSPLSLYSSDALVIYRTLYTSAGAVQAGSDTTYINWWAEGAWNPGLLAPGTYYLRIVGYNSYWYTGPYGLGIFGQNTFNTFFLSAKGSNMEDAQEDDSIELGHIPEYPVPIAAGSPANRFLAENDVEWFTFTLP